MAENLQHLLERIQKDGIEKAQTEAEAILSSAQREADSILREAEAKRDDIIAKAESGAEEFAERGKKALQQAARDIVLSVGDAIGATLQGIVDREISDTMNPDVLKKLIANVVQAYCSGDTSVDISVSEEDEKAIVEYFLKEMKDAIHQGCTIRGDGRISAGFQASMADGHVSHDFTDEAVAEAMARLVRPHLADVVRKAIADTQKG